MGRRQRRPGTSSCPVPASLLGACGSPTLTRPRLVVAMIPVHPGESLPHGSSWRQGALHIWPTVQRTRGRGVARGPASPQPRTWQPAFSSIWAYFTVLSISGKTRILHVTGTESFSCASKTGEKENRLLRSVVFTSGRRGACLRQIPSASVLQGPGRGQSTCRQAQMSSWCGMRGLTAAPAVGRVPRPGLSGRRLRAPLATTTQPDSPPTARGQLTHSLEQVPLLLQEGTIVTCKDQHGPQHPFPRVHTGHAPPAMPVLRGHRNNHRVEQCLSITLGGSVPRCGAQGH